MIISFFIKTTFIIIMACLKEPGALGLMFGNTALKSLNTFCQENPYFIVFITRKD